MALTPNLKAGGFAEHMRNIGESKDYSNLLTRARQYIEEQKDKPVVVSLPKKRRTRRIVVNDESMYQSFLSEPRKIGVIREEEDDEAKAINNLKVSPDNDYGLYSAARKDLSSKLRSKIKRAKGENHTALTRCRKQDDSVIHGCDHNGGDQARTLKPPSERHL